MEVSVKSEESDVGISELASGCGHVQHHVVKAEPQGDVGAPVKGFEPPAHCLYVKSESVEHVDIKPKTEAYDHELSLPAECPRQTLLREFNKERRHVTKPKHEPPHPVEITVEIEEDSDARAYHNKRIPKIFHCDICDKNIKNLSSFQEHQRMHTGDRPYECSQCQKRFVRCADLIKHRLVHSDLRPHACPVCGKCFKLQADVSKHLAVHTPEYPFQCRSCGKGFKRAACRNKHERVHSAESPFRCPTCARSFKWETSLTEHLRTHSGERPYVCPEEGCGKSFTHRSTMVQHRRTHLNQRQFHCRYCQRGFNHRSNLVKHERTVRHGSQPEKQPTS
ncbi:zinc finger protein 13-like [Arapaima gigas]